MPKFGMTLIALATGPAAASALARTPPAAAPNTRRPASAR
jgi:hypothetical protein